MAAQGVCNQLLSGESGRWNPNLRSKVNLWVGNSCRTSCGIGPAIEQMKYQNPLRSNFIKELNENLEKPSLPV